MSHSPCKITQEYRNAAGYGQITHNGKLEYHHRVAYCTAAGIDIADIKGKVVMHLCDTPGCINPEHLKLGTASENIADRHRKGRTRTGTTRGQDHHFNKLTPEDVQRIRVSVVSTRKLAKIYGVNQSAISAIQNLRNWAHLPWPEFTAAELKEINAYHLQRLTEGETE